MWALIESNSVSKIYSHPTSLLLNGIRHPANIFNLWSEAELKAIGIYSISINNITYAYNSDADTVSGSYGTATAKAIADTLYTSEDEDNGLGTEGEVKNKGLKTQHKEKINRAAAGFLSDTDWMVVRAAEGGTAVPSANTTYRAAVRTAANSMCTKIDNAANLAALIALYVYTDGTRPLGEFPNEI